MNVAPKPASRLAQHMEERLGNPFCVPGRTVAEPGPLCPWSQSEHQDCFIPVDHTEDAFSDFKNKFPTLNAAANGAAILVHGGDGCGKSSLSHRCTFHAKDSLEKDHELKVEILDRSRERLDGQVVERKCEDVASCILRHLRRAKNFLSQATVEGLPQVTSGADHNQLRRIMEDVSGILEENERGLVLLTPKVELSEEFRAYLSIFVRKRITVLMETDQDAVVQFVTRWNEDPKNRRVVKLSVGPLAADDGWAFVSARLGVRSESVRFSRDGVLKYMQTRCEHSNVTVRELERVCIQLYEYAITRSIDLIEYAHFADLWVRVGHSINT